MGTMSIDFIVMEDCRQSCRRVLNICFTRIELDDLSPMYERPRQVKRSVKPAQGSCLWAH
jgi:hypothetical protein